MGIRSDSFIFFKLISSVLIVLTDNDRSFVLNEINIFKGTLFNNLILNNLEKINKNIGTYKIENINRMQNYSTNKLQRLLSKLHEDHRIHQKHCIPDLLWLYVVFYAN